MKLRETHRSRRSPSRAAAAAASRRLTSAGDVSGGARRLLRAYRGLALAFAVAGALLATTGAAPAAAQAGPVYTASPPTSGALYRDGPTDRWLLGGAWLYRADPGLVGVTDGWWRNLAGTDGWSPVAVPNSYNAGDFSTASMNGSVGWYRRDFTVPESAFAPYVPARYRSWIIRFESVNYRATVWLNGHKVGSHAGAYLPFEFDLKGVRNGVNRLIVRVDDRRTGGDLPPGPSGGWWNFGGINREVYLRSVQRADMSPVVVRPILPCPTCAASVQEQVSVRNLTGDPETVVLRGSYGSAPVQFGAHTIAPHATWTAHAKITIAAPHLWAIDDPFLYRAGLRLSDAAGRKLEGWVSYSGIRSITVASTGQLLLNGRALDLRGFSLHEQSLQTGAALSPAQLTALVGWVRALHGTIIRAHYPLNPQIAELADRDGILLWSEIPVYQVSSTYLTRTAWLATAHGMLRQNILTNENHPSVLLWSIANELTTPPDDAETRYIAGAAQLAHQLDPTRPVAMAISDWPGVTCQPAYAPLDVIGFNDYFGWFDAGGGTTDDPDALSPFLDGLHGCYPSKSLMISEFGFEGNRAGPPEERGTYQAQADAAAFHLGVFASKPYVSGAMWFALQDFAARPGWGGGDPFPDPPFVQKGEIDPNGAPRQPLFSTVQSIYGSTVQIAPASVSPAVSRGSRTGSARGSRSRGIRRAR
jgi:beta-glucuronidase